MSGDETFIERWSRRKQNAQEPVAAPPAVTAAPGDTPAELTEPPPGAHPPATTPAPPKADEPFDLSKLPSIENLGRESDYSMFMHKAVPDDLRLKALRRMWQTDPVMAAPDLLDMHAWDYTGNDGLRPLVAPAIQAVAAAAKEFLDRSKESKATETKNPPPAPEASGSEPPAAGLPAPESPAIDSTQAPTPSDTPWRDGG